MTSAPFHVVLATCFLLSWSLPHPRLQTPLLLSFTQTFYDVTIPENSVGRTLVTSSDRMGVKRRTDQDDVTFRIVTGDPDRIFKVEGKRVGDFVFLVLRTRGGNPVVINRERKDKFVLTVKAFSERGSLEATTIINVRVVDQNDLSPIFYPSTYNETVPEDLTLHRSIFKVAAEDPDLGVNGEVMFWIREPTEHFTVHPSTGDVTLTKRLKYAERSVHELTIVAQDRATIFRGGGQSSLARVSIRVKQVNLYGPEIYVYVLQDPSAHKLGLVCAVVRVVDRDEGSHGEIDSIRIVEGDPQEIFIVEPVDEFKNKSKTEYNIILTNRTNTERTPSIHNLSLQVFDKGFPQRMSYKAVSIRVVNDVDAQPSFDRDFYDVNVPEYIPQGTPLLRLTLANREQFAQDELVFKILDGNLNDAFRINQRTHTLYTNAHLDAKEQRRFTLNVAVHRRENPVTRHASTVKVKINVMDSNDNDPVFDDVPEELSVAENEPAGTHVAKMSAPDNDSEDNGFVTYRVVNLNFVPFEIDPLSGVLRTTQPMDFESMKREFNVRVRASDSGSPFRREAERVVSVKTRNVNDNVPVFTKGDCSLSIPRNLPVGTNLFTLSATDMDDTDIINYRVTSTPREDCFRIEATRGVLSLHCNMSSVGQTEWGLNVTASDGTFKTDTFVRVFVSSSEIITSQSSPVQYSCREIGILKDQPKQVLHYNHFDKETLIFDLSNSNKNDPVITGLPKRINLDEAIATNSTILKVTAFDKDGGFSGNLVYGMMSEPDDSIFKIDPDSGEVKVTWCGGDDIKSTYILNVSVCDQGSPARCALDSVSVDVVRLKNKPHFVEGYYNVHVPENTEVSTELLSVKAIGTNITYSSVSDRFRIDSETGAIFLNAPLDRETAESHSITVTAGTGCDSSDRSSSTVTVTFYVDDVNDNAPKFVNTLLEAIVREDAPKGSVIFVINAVDEDEGSGGEILYSLEDIDVFSIDSTTGTVRLQGRLDYETRVEHSVLVVARDGGVPQLSSQTVLTVSVVDVDENLHPPMFDEVVVTGSVRENLPSGTLVTTVAASDADLPGADSKIVYSIRGGDGLGLFSITEQGNILTSAILDFEAADHYWLTVVAEDCALMPLSASIQVFITVENDNDHLPFTADASYHFTVEENLPSHSNVGHVTSEGDVTFSLLHPASGRQPFTIGANTGFITTSALLDREETKEYTLQVLTSDKTSPSRSSTTLVYISVVDVNDHAPQFDSDHYNVQLHHVPQHLPEKFSIKETEITLPDGETWITSSFEIIDSIVPVFQVLATDNDDGKNGKVTYSSKNSAQFTLHAETGLIYLRTRVTPGREYDLLVKASDAGTPSRSTTTKVTVYCPHKTHTHRKLPAEELTVTVKEDLLPGELVVKLNPPWTDSSQQTYTITAGNGTGYLAVRGDALLVAGRLDCERANNLGLSIRAANLSAVWTIKVTVKVEDVNEFTPTFNSSEYIVKVSESTPTGAVLAVLRASDKDLTSNLSYHIQDVDPYSEMLAVDPLSGIIYLTGPLDREKSRLHRFTAAVSDGGEHSRTGYARVIIHVEDENDNKPVWPQDSLSLTISEDTPPETELVTLPASDRDDGRYYGNIAYSITSGNTNSTFTIQTRHGTLVLAKPLNWSAVAQFTLTVRAQDGGSPILYSELSLHIRILKSAKRPTRCLRLPDWLEVSETAKVGEVVGKIPVEPSPSLLYEIVSGDPRGHFKVNPYSGDILVQLPLDFESVPGYNLSVSLTNMAGIKSFCNIIVYVIDHNDNPPVFEKETYTGYILESAKPGSFVMTEGGPLRILATDLDSGVNGMVEFKILDSSQRNLLSIDAITGAVRTAAALDYELVKEISVLISATDLGQPALSSQTVATLRVHIGDVNDCPPVFDQPVYDVTLVLPMYRGVLVVQVSAADPDSENVTSLSYTILSGTEDLGLRMDTKSGEIFVDNPLKMHSQRIKVLVSDGVHQDTAYVDIQLRKREQVAIRFQKDIYHAAILENVTSTSIVAVVSVLGSRLNEDIHFSLLNPSPTFSIGRTSGIISTGHLVFDRELLDHYQLIVQAHSVDRGMTSYTTVNVSVLDANDNCPYFLNLPYRATLTTNATKGDFVFKVVAKDLDTGDNGEVRYELDQTGSDLFRVGRKSGEIRLKSLSVHTRKETVIVILATDGGIVPCTTSTSLTVATVPALAPLWERTVYKAQVAESAALLSTVAVTLKASGVNRVVYQLLDSDNNFLLHHSTGVLQVYSHLDRETTPLHRLTVRATDAVSRLSADTLLLLEVTDINDCHPEFQHDSYHVRWSEDIEVGTTVSRVTATDRDEGMNAEVHYSMIDQHFRIDANDGSIILQKRLDYEKADSHQLTVFATDAGIPPLSSFVTVFVEVLNSNDNPPVLLASPFHFKVSPDTPRGTTVGRIQARDEDGDSLSFRISSREEHVGRVVDIGLHTGIVSILNPNILQDMEVLAVNFIVDDGLHSTSGVLEVRTLLSNRAAPQFDTARYQAVVRENLPSGRSVARVAATDPDTGLFGNVTYILPSQRSSQFFSIDISTGEISTRKPLDRELAASHLLLVQARDGGGFMGWTTVEVEVLDQNDNKPVFELPAYFACVGGNVRANQTITKVRAVDADVGAAGSVEYYVTSAAPRLAQHWFSIHPLGGTVSATRLITHKDVQSVKLTLRASDGGEPPLHSDVTLDITFMSRDTPPLLDHHFPSQLVVPRESISANNVYHTGLNFSNYGYRIIGGNSTMIGFTDLGLVLTQHTIDFQLKKIGFLVKSSKGIDCAFREISIEHSQTSYSVPKFVEDTVKLEIPENIAVGSLIYKVSTTDDTPVLFRFVEPSPWFSIDPLTGWISVASPLDRETQEELEIEVVVSYSQFASDISVCTIVVTLADHNDNPHIFNQDLYNVAVKEDTTVGHVLVHLALTDPDKQRGVLVWDTGDPTFGVTSDLELVLLWSLDREKVPSYALVVSASDGVFTATTRVNILVIDVNDQRHHCLHSAYSVSVSEARPPGHLLTTVLTSDPDLESNLSFRLSGTASERFTIDNHGEVRLRQFLDREIFPDHLLEATATDPTHPAWTCTSRIRVSVEDVNDNAPTFAVNNETITVTEDATVDMIVGQLQVLDFDEGDNRRVHFALVDPAGLFNLSSDTGVLTLVRLLQSSPGSVHHVTARVSDYGQPSLASLTTLQVIVLGMNDDPPLLVALTIHVTVAEDAPVYTSLWNLARDFAPEDSSVIYTILEGNTRGEFDLDRRTGILSTCKPLDHETSPAYQLLVLATSLGDSSLTTYISFNVTVLDVNDNPPTFKVNRYTLQIREDVEVGQMVLKVDADDVDAGRNGVIRFSIDELSRRHFVMEPHSGVITVGSRLDREHIATHEVVVLATDHGTPPLSGTATVTIDVMDVNDNPPLFLHPNATAVLQADRLPGWAVFHFAVTDADQTGDRTSYPPPSFLLTAGNEREMFRVDSDGTLRTTDKLSVLLGDTFTLTVRVEDGGRVPVLHSTTWIHIKVVEPSKHPPTITPLRVWVGVYEHQWRGGDLGHVTASDLDPYDQLEYSVSATTLFAVDPRLGVLKARASLDPGVYSVNVSVTDGKFSTSSLVAVTVDLLLQDMLQSSVYVRLSSVVRREVLVTRLPVFLSTLRSAFLRDVSLISIQDIPNSTIGVLIAVAGGADLAVVREVLLSSGLTGSTPQCDCRNGGVCQRQLQMMPDRTNVFSIPGLSFVTPGHSLAYYCICSMGYAGDHCEEVKCQCPPLQVCVPQRVGFACMPPCSANETCPASMTSSVTWSDVATYLLTSVGIIVTICVFIVYRKHRSSSGDRKYGSWGKHNSYIKKKTKLSNLEASQKPPIFTGSPNNGTISRNNLETTPGATLESETIPLDYLRNINPVAKLENDIIQGHSSAPDLATCHGADSFVSDDPARELAALDERLSHEVIEYGFPPPEAALTIQEHTL